MHALPPKFLGSCHATTAHAEAYPRKYDLHFFILLLPSVFIRALTQNRTHAIIPTVANHSRSSALSLSTNEHTMARNRSNVCIAGGNSLKPPFPPRFADFNKSEHLPSRPIYRNMCVSALISRTTWLICVQITAPHTHWCETVFM